MSKNESPLILITDANRNSTAFLIMLLSSYFCIRCLKFLRQLDKRRTSKCCTKFISVWPLFTCTQIFSPHWRVWFAIFYLARNREAPNAFPLLPFRDAGFEVSISARLSRVCCTFLFSQGRVRTGESQTFIRGPLVFYLYYIEKVVSRPLNLKDQIHCSRQDCL